MIRFQYNNSVINIFLATLLLVHFSETCSILHCYNLGLLLWFSRESVVVFQVRKSFNQWGIKWIEGREIIRSFMGLSNADVNKPWYTVPYLFPTLVSKYITPAITVQPTFVNIHSIHYLGQPPFLIPFLPQNHVSLTLGICGISAKTDTSRYLTTQNKIVIFYCKQYFVFQDILFW